MSKLDSKKMANQAPDKSIFLGPNSYNWRRDDVRNGKPKMVAIIASRRELLTILNAMIKEKETCHSIMCDQSCPQRCLTCDSVIFRDEFFVRLTIVSPIPRIED